jgi:hypothetical protein
MTRSARRVWPQPADGFQLVQDPRQFAVHLDTPPLQHQVRLPELVDAGGASTSTGCRSRTVAFPVFAALEAVVLRWLGSTRLHVEQRMIAE